MADGLVIIGGSYAGAQIAASVRELGYAEPIHLVSEEDVLPYHRPPLSKGWLLGGIAPHDLLIRGESFYQKQGVIPFLSSRVESIDLPSRKVVFADGRRLGFTKLALATGARARQLAMPGAELAGVMTLRSLADAQFLGGMLGEVSDIVMLGAGFIGLELASTLAKLGKQVTIIESQARLLARAIPGVLSDYLDAAHRRQGVTICYQTTIAAIEGEGGKVRAIRCSDGTRLAADLLLVGIGAMPNSELALSAGLPCPNGIEIDQFARTTHPDIVAAGDCALHPSRWTGRMTRLESVQNATDQAKSAAASLVGRSLPYDAVPWFWSDQCGVKLQMAGIAGDQDQIVIRGARESGKFSIFHLQDGVITSVDSINAPGDHMLGRKLVTARAKVTPDQAADLSFDLKSLLG